jgi:heme-degrading monooxygenase HmoA
VIVIIRAQVRSGFEQEVARIQSIAHELAVATPGFITADAYHADDGATAVLLEFESHEALAAWRDNPANLATQAAGRDRLFERYRIQVCDTVREYEFAG